MTAAKRRRRPPVKPGRAYRSAWRLMWGAIDDCFKQHPDYFTNKGHDAARLSLCKRTTGALIGFACETAKGRSEGTVTSSAADKEDRSIKAASTQPDRHSRVATGGQFKAATGGQAGGVKPPLATYPDHAGWHDSTTSRENAERIENSGKVRTLRDMVRTFFETGGEDTADGVAIRLGLPFRAIQPRVAELKAKGFIEPTGERRRGSGGGTAHVWRWRGAR